MGELTDTTFSGGQRITNYSTQKLPIHSCEYLHADFTNSDAYPTTLRIGTVMGRVSATGKVVPLDTDSSDGSQFPIGVLAANYTVGDGDTLTVAMVSNGTINGNMLIFVDNTDSLDTVVSSRQLRDHLQLAGINLQFPDELSELDNQ